MAEKIRSVLRVIIVVGTIVGMVAVVKAIVAGTTGFVVANFDSINWAALTLIAAAAVPLIGLYIFLRLIFAIIHRLER